MKKVVLLIIIIVLALLPFQGAVAFAETQEEEQEAAKKIGQEVDNRINELNLNAFEAFFLRLEDEYLKSLGSGIKDIIKNIIDGKTKLDLATVFNSIIKMLISSVLKVLPLMIMIIIIAILYGVFSGLTSGFSKASTNQIIYIVCYGAIITILGYAVADAVVSVKKTVSDMDTLMGYCFPVLLTLTSALGGVGSAGIYQPLMTVMTTVMIKVINVFILPMFIASVVFGIVGNLSDSIKLEKLNKTTKSIAEWTLGIIFSLFITFITAQGITGTAFDTVTMKIGEVCAVKLCAHTRRLFIGGLRPCAGELCGNKKRVGTLQHNSSVFYSACAAGEDNRAYFRAAYCLCNSRADIRPENIKYAVFHFKEPCNACSYRRRLCVYVFYYGNADYYYV